MARRGAGKIGAEAAVQVCGPQPAQKVGAGAVHGHLVEVAGTVLGGDQHDFRPIRLGQAPGQGLADHRRGEILVLQIDGPPRAPDGGQVQALDLVDLMPPAPGRFGAGEGDLDVLQVRRQPDRPGIVARVLGRGGDRVAGGAQPAAAGELAHGLGRLAVHQHHDLVPGRRAAAAGHDPPRILVEVGGGVPAVGGEVGAATEGDQVVDHQHLLVMAGAVGDAGVQAEAHRRAVEPGPRAVGKEVLRGADRQRAFPDQHAYVEIRPAAGQGLQDVADLVRRAGDLLRAGLQPGAGVEAPAEQQDRAPRLPDGREGGGEIGGAVHQEGDAPRRRLAPVGSFTDERGRGGEGRGSSP